MKAVDLFCWCWWLSLWFLQAWFTIMAAFDNRDKAINIYKKNFNHPVFDYDLTDVEWSSKIIKNLKPDIIIWWPPCQDFSSAWKRNEDNWRWELTISYAKIISSVKPNMFVMENVSQIKWTNKLEEAKKIYKKAWYWLTEIELDASLCGVPQKRKRFFLIWKIDEKDDFLKDNLIKNIWKNHMTIRDYVWDKRWIEYYYRHPRSYMRRWIFSIDEPSPTIRWVNRPLPKWYKLHPNDPVNSLEWIRCLTTKERSILQTFPENFIFEWSKTDIEQMVWNAVPVNLAKYVGLAIIAYM